MMYSEAASNGIQVGQNPRPYSCIVMAGSAPGYPNCGHVAFIENIKVDKNGNVEEVEISEGNYNSPGIAATQSNPMAYTRISKWKSVEEYMSNTVPGFILVGYIY